ncbi:hypothetical protein ACIBQ1_35370 [Nonomuraea sp. NPDC050153]|uniref:hypothetical protein n=1 Tax=Nonomuraea sp. NPDC050153 TaxID=3364359 RepID=UPI0037AA491F
MEAGIAKLRTSREREGSGLMAEGLFDAELGARLFGGEPAINYRLSRLRRELNLRDRLKVAAFAHRNRLAGNYER